jgi:hypothetical protein
MKRTLALLLVVGLLVSFGAAEYRAQDRSVITIGLITYAYEGSAWPVESLVRILERDLETLPPPESYNLGTALPQPPRTDPLVKFETVIADTADAQVAAIQAFVDQGVDGLIIAPVPDTEPIRNALDLAILAKIPVVAVHRPIPGLSGRLTAYVGLEPFAVGIGWARGATERNRNFIAVATDLVDPLQSGLVRGFAAKAGDLYQGTVMVTPETIADELTPVLTNEDLPINYVIVADYRITEAVADFVLGLTGGTDRLIKVGSFMAPEDGRAMIAAKKVHFVTTQDHYDMFQTAALELKMFNVSAVPLDTDFIGSQVWGGLSGQNYMSYPYDYAPQISFTFNRFW